MNIIEGEYYRLSDGSEEILFRVISENENDYDVTNYFASDYRGNITYIAREWFIEKKKLKKPTYKLNHLSKEDYDRIINDSIHIKSIDGEAYVYDDSSTTELYIVNTKDTMYKIEALYEYNTRILESVNIVKYDNESFTKEKATDFLEKYREENGNEDDFIGIIDEKDFNIELKHIIEDMTDEY